MGSNPGSVGRNPRLSGSWYDADGILYFYGIRSLDILAPSLIRTGINAWPRSNYDSSLDHFELEARIENS